MQKNGLKYIFAKIYLCKYIFYQYILAIYKYIFKSI